MIDLAIKVIDNHPMACVHEFKNIRMLSMYCGMGLILHTRYNRSSNEYRICVWEALNVMGTNVIRDDQL